MIGFCCDFLFSWLDDSNILEVDKLADVYSLRQLGAKVHSYILRNIQTFSRTEVYRQLPPEKVFSVLCSNELEVASENEVYEAALHYHYSPEQVETDQVCLQVRPSCLPTPHPTPPQLRHFIPCGRVPVCGWFNLGRLGELVGCVPRATEPRGGGN